MLLNYKDYEKKVYDWLMSKNNQDSAFTFSLRQKSNTGSETDYFIGTEKSKYFATSFWYVPVGFPGSSGDCLGLVFEYTKTGYHYFFEFKQTKAPHDDQNRAALKLVELLEQQLDVTLGFQKRPTAENKMYILQTKTPKESYGSIEEMIKDIEKDIEIIFPVVENTISEVKKSYPTFKANRYTTDEFATIIKKHVERIKRFETSENMILSHDKPIEKVVRIIPKANKPLNRILYGPPGTGKTYTLKNEYFSKYTLTENSISPEVYFEETVSNLTWWQVIALALLEIGTNRVNEILENRWVAKKAQLSESKNVRATIWGTLQMHTLVESTTVNYTQRQTPFLFNKTADKRWELHENELKEQVPELYDTLASVNNFKPSSDKEIKHYVFTTFHQSFSYEDFIEGIKPVMEEGKDNVTYRIENGIFKELCLRAQNDPNNRYAIFIDEINRGNISQIFGELITLIEEDKRIGASNEIKVKLPYSKKEFGVPSNIDIYGTMNTADRSVEALDTALRRRFSFVELMPDSFVVEKLDLKDYQRKEIMELINNRVEVLLDKNHTLGHAYFIKDDFEHSFKNEIIPLLQEYFYNDCGKLGLILGKGFVRAKELTRTTNPNIFAEFETKNEIDIVQSYELIPFEEVDFKTAIATLLA